MADVDKYTKTYSTFGVSDILCSFDGVVIGEVQAITYSITREKVNYMLPIIQIENIKNT